MINEGNVGNEECFEVNGSTDSMASNLLEKGRYKFVVKDATNFTSSNNNKCVKLVITVEGRTIFDNLLLEGQMSWKWRQFLFAIGIRDKRTAFTVPKNKIVGGEGLVDIGVKDRTLGDGSIIKENKINSYSPIEEETAPIKGVEPEEETKIEPEKKEDDDDL